MPTRNPDPFTIAYESGKKQYSVEELRRICEQAMQRSANESAGKLARSQRLNRALKLLLLVFTVLIIGILWLALIRSAERQAVLRLRSFAGAPAADLRDLPSALPTST